MRGQLLRSSLSQHLPVIHFVQIHNGNLINKNDLKDKAVWSLNCEAIAFGKSIMSEQGFSTKLIKKICSTQKF